LSSRCDDATVVVRSIEEVPHVVQTSRRSGTGIEHRKNENGSWTAAFRWPLQVEAEGRTVEDCRYRVGNALDEKLAAWLTGSADAAGGRQLDR
jgi:hypothetical protein